MLLNQKERDRFATYAKQEADSNEALAGQMAKLSVGPLTLVYRAKAAAWKAVAAELSKPVDSVTISAGGG